MAKRELNKKTSELLITTTASKEVWKVEQEKAFKVLKEGLTVKGFRKGQIPDGVAKQHIKGVDIQAKAITKMLDVLVQEAAKEIKEDEMILDSPTYKVDKISDSELEITFIYPLYPEIKLSDWKKTGAKYELKEVSKDTVKSEIDRMLNSQSMLTVKKGKVVKGDTVKFDFDGFVDGEQFEGGQANDYELEIGSGQFIPGFEDQMIGMEKSEEKDIKVTFPAEYHSEKLKGKDATFKVKVHEVKTKERPELNDEFVKTSGVPDVKTVAELEKYIAKVFKTQEEQNARANFQKEAFEKIKKETELNIPTQLIAKEMQNQAKQFEEQMKQQGLDIKKYLELTGLTVEKLNSQFKSKSEERLQDSLIFAEIAKELKIELTDADYEAEYKKLAVVYGQTEDAIKGMITKPQMQIPMTNDRVIDAMIKASK